MMRTDGFEDGVNTIQGVRAFDSNAGQWVSPDAYTGDVHDPMSQRAYVWNGANPVVFADPSGYGVGPLAIICAWVLSNAPEIVAGGVALLEGSAGVASSRPGPGTVIGAIERGTVSKCQCIRRSRDRRLPAIH
jgi:hypothetical protein